MSDICRVCLKSGKLISLFHSKNSMKFSDKIMMCTSVRIVPDDNLPSHICSVCIIRLNASYNFKILCEASDTYLRKKTLKRIHESHSVEIKSELIKCENDGISDCKPKSKIASNSKVSSNFKLYIPLSDEDDSVSYDKSEESNSDTSENLIDNYDSVKKKTRPNLLSKLCDDLDLSKNDDKCKSTNKSSKEQCSTCGKVMSSKFRLKMHHRIHTGEKPFTCNYCEKTFSLSQNLKVHERVHTGEKPLLCGICGKAFAQSAGLVTHMRLHTGETPYKCTLCPMKFRTPGHLQYHIRQHTGEKNYECSTCHKAFITKGDLTQHARIHTGEKPFVCTICGVRMSRSSHLTRHLMTHTGEKPHKCNTCGTSYAQKGDLVRHIKKHPMMSCKASDLQSKTKSTEVDCKLSDNNKINSNIGTDDRAIIVENKLVLADNMAVKTTSSNPINQNTTDFKYEFTLDQHNISMVKKETNEPEILGHKF